MTTSRVPLILAIVLLLLPVLYVGSYFALVTPYSGPKVLGSSDGCGVSPRVYLPTNYRCAGMSRYYLRLEALDSRLLRRKLWDDAEKRYRERFWQEALEEARNQTDRSF